MTFFLDEPSPLDYHGHSPQRISLVDPTTPPPEPGDHYFAVTTRTVKRGATGRDLKKPRIETTPGAGPGVVAFLDYDVHGDGSIFVHYVATRRDQRGRGYMTALLEELLRRHKAAPWIDLGKVFSESAWRWLEKKKMEDPTSKLHGKKWNGRYVRNSGHDESVRGLERKIAVGDTTEQTLRRYANALERASGPMPLMYVRPSIRIPIGWLPQLGPPGFGEDAVENIAQERTDWNEFHEVVFADLIRGSEETYIRIERHRLDTFLNEEDADATGDIYVGYNEVVSQAYITMPPIKEGGRVVAPARQATFSLVRHCGGGDRVSSNPTQDDEIRRLERLIREGDESTRERLDYLGYYTSLPNNPGRFSSKYSTP